MSSAEDKEMSIFISELFGAVIQVMVFILQLTHYKVSHNREYNLNYDKSKYNLCI